MPSVLLPRTSKNIQQAMLTGLLLFMTAAQPVSAATDDVASLLKKITSADRELNYQGVFIMRKADRIISMRVSHAADDGRIRENLESLNGESHRIIRDNDKYYTIHPDRKTVRISKGHVRTELHPALPENLDKLAAYYDIERLRDDRIADHDTAVLKLKPRDDYRYGYQYWVDADTGVLLRCDMLDQDNKAIEQMMFTQFEYKDDLPVSTFSVPGLDKMQQRHLGDNRQQTGESGWQVAKLPAGFVLTQSSQRSKGDNHYFHLVYSDGLASVSVFIETGKSQTHFLDGATSIGALNAYGARIGDVFVTVMGEVPAETVETIAMSTQPTNGYED